MRAVTENESPEPVAEVVYSQEKADPNASLIEAWNTTGQRNGAIRMRLQPQLLIDRPAPTTGKPRRKTMFLSWRHVWWNLDFPDVSTGIAFREALASFMRLLEFMPAREIQKVLDREARRLAELATSQHG